MGRAHSCLKVRKSQIEAQLWETMKVGDLFQENYLPMLTKWEQRCAGCLPPALTSMTDPAPRKLDNTEHARILFCQRAPFGRQRFLVPHWLV
jgi:hypothetical protein